MNTLRESAIINASFVLLCMTAPAFATQPDYDFSSPEAVFRTCGRAIKNDDPHAYRKATLTNRSPVYDAQFLQEIWDGKDSKGRRHYGIGLCSTVVLSTGKIAEYFLEAEFLKETEVRAFDGGVLRKIIVKWEAANLIREESFVRFDNDGHWRWGVDLYSQDTPYFLSYATPTEAFWSIGRAQSLRLEQDVCEGLANAARGGMDIKKCAEAIRGRMTKSLSSEEVNSMLTSCGDCLEEEMFTDKDGRQMCRVWKLVKNKQGERKRQGYQLFIKEGDEWKWLPDEKSFWRLDRPMPDSK